MVKFGLSIADKHEHNEENKIRSIVNQNSRARPALRPLSTRLPGHASHVILGRNCSVIDGKYPTLPRSP